MREVNRKNMIKFANSLYSEKNDNIYYKPLCTQHLAKANGEVVGCALGEMWEFFEDEPLYRLLTDEEKALHRSEGYDDGEFCGDYTICTGTAVFVTEDDIVDRIVEKAFVKVPSSESPRAFPYTRANASVSDDDTDDAEFELANAISNLPNINDIGGNTERSMIARAKRVQKAVLKIAEMLK